MIGSFPIEYTRVSKTGDLTLTADIMGGEEEDRIPFNNARIYTRVCVCLHA